MNQVEQPPEPLPTVDPDLGALVCAELQSTTSTCPAAPPSTRSKREPTPGDLRQQLDAIRVRPGGGACASARSDTVGHFLVQGCQP